MSVTLDGSADYWKASTFRIADGKEGTLALWFKPAIVGSTRALIFVGNPAAAISGFSVALNALSGITIVGRNAADTTILGMLTTGLTLVTTQWYFLLASWDLAAGVSHLYVNDVDRESTNTLTNDTIDYTREWWIGASNNGSDVAATLYGGELDYIYFASSYLDVSVEANRRLFYGELGEQIGLGAEARRPLSGTRPELFLAGGPGTYGRNLGTGGDLAAFGSPTWSYGRPAAVETLSRGFRGEAWRESERSGIPFPESELVHEPASGLEVARREFSTDRDEERRGRHYRRRGVGVRG